MAFQKLLNGTGGIIMYSLKHFFVFTIFLSIILSQNSLDLQSAIKEYSKSIEYDTKEQKPNQDIENSNLIKKTKNPLQDSARNCKILQDSARHSKILQDLARVCNHSQVIKQLPYYKKVEIRATTIQQQHNKHRN